MDTTQIKLLSEEYVAQTYSRFPIAMVKGKGCKLWDAEGKEYLDLVSGLGVNNIGHSHPYICEVIKRQAETLIHTSNLFHIPQQAKLAQEIVECTFPGKVFFANSGAEANEAAIKLARKYGQSLGPGRFEIITAYNSFHGRTMAALSATAQEKYQKGFHPLLSGFKYAPYNDIPAIEAAITPQTCAVMVEPIQGEGGVNVPSPGYLPDLRKLCDDKGIILILDEVQTGMGRTGRLFNFQYHNLYPDILTIAKSLAGGVPIGAMVANKEIVTAFGPGSHASTFGGNFLASAAALAVLEVIEKEGLLQNCQNMGELIFKELAGLKKGFPLVKEVRGQGLMIGIELYKEGRGIVQKCLEQGLIINCTMDRVLRLLPPLIITPQEIEKTLGILSKNLKDTSL